MPLLQVAPQPTTYPRAGSPAREREAGGASTAPAAGTERALPRRSCAPKVAGHLRSASKQHWHRTTCACSHLLRVSVQRWQLALLSAVLTELHAVYPELRCHLFGPAGLPESEKQTAQLCSHAQHRLITLCCFRASRLAGHLRWMRCNAGMQDARPVGLPVGERSPRIGESCPA